jgi:hypothetical protein
LTASGTVLIYPVRATDEWWRYVGENLGFEKSVVVSDIRGVGDYCVVEDFYAQYDRQMALAVPGSPQLSAEETTDVIARCRLLRWLPRKRAEAMVHAMAIALERVLDEVKPVAVVCFPIDRYVSDVLERLAKARGIPCFELTASLLAGMSMVLYRGALLTLDGVPDPEVVERCTHEIADPLFTPTYVQVKNRYTLLRFFAVFGYFRLRGVVFWLISLAQRDPLNLHYLDAQPFLGHKPRLADYRVVGMQDRNWRPKLKAFPKERRIFFGLQLFPEASIDYWLENVDLLDYENILVEAAQAFSKAGYLILVKDHPLQFGFRQRELIERLLAIPNTVFVPYEVSGNEILSLVGANFSFTGTLGLQAALLGLKSVVTPTYYVTAEDFVTFNDRRDIADLPRRVMDMAPPASLAISQRRIVSRLLQGSFEGDFFSFKGFDRAVPKPGALSLAQRFGEWLRAYIGRS